MTASLDRAVEAALLPCPFCGGSPKHKRHSLGDHYAYADRVAYVCAGCGVEIIAMGDCSKPGYADNSTVEQRALAAWNRRAALPHLGVDREALRGLQVRAKDVHDRFFWMVSPDRKGNHTVCHASVDAAISLAYELLHLIETNQEPGHAR